MSSKSPFSVYLTAALLAVLLRPAPAETISVNFNNGQFTLLESTDIAGVVPDDNWNNFANNGGRGLINSTPTELIDSTGVASGANVIWSASQSAFNSNNGQGNQRMMEGWFGLNAVNGDHITVTGLPSAFTDAGYDLYVYYDSQQVAPNEVTMNFAIEDGSITGTELPVNYAGEFIESVAEGAGNYVVFRGLTESDFSLNGVTGDGEAASVNGLQITTEIPRDLGSLIHQYDASVANTNENWQDPVGGFHWTLAGAERIRVDSSNTNITTAYRILEPGTGIGGDTKPFTGGNISYELWVRPDDLTNDHQVIFETGGGQNGTSLLATENEIRLLNSSGNERGIDISVPLGGIIDKSDFIQIVAALNPAEDTIDLYVNGSAGGSEVASGNGTVGRGGNRASLFTWGSGLANAGVSDDDGAGTFNLGGRTELDDRTPVGLTQFTGDISVINVYSETLTSDAVFAAFAERLTVGVELKCDFNDDQLCDVADINTLLSAGDLSAGVDVADNNRRLDLNGDNTIAPSDIVEWLSLAATENGLSSSYAQGDANLDGTVDALDLNAVGLNWQESGKVWSTGDFTGDGNVSPADLNLLGLNWQTSVPNAAQAVPEPSTHTLLLLVTICCLKSGRRER